MQYPDYKTHLLSQRGANFPREMGDASSLLDPDALLNKLWESLADVTGKYKEAMVYIAQLDKENRNLVYEVDNLKDIIEEMEEKISEYHKEHENNSKEFHILQITLEEFKKSLHYRDELLLKHGIVPEDTPSYAIAQEIKVGMRHLVSQEDKVQRLEPAGDTEQGHTF
ncbi:leucine-rich repeat flightless-interacting protein 2-like isoform X1 [Pseudophryne corroboree]|uniref:leucine-rich repeat flightless-interacting protein 2-like isoform X1 n=1 Tax=Pseudophryne corroboree TaxID=495146 RepID=UPI0030817676